MPKRRDDILDTAERLFNERGYQSVSLRDIAQELHISKGNLTYYFQKKEDLIEACMARIHRNYEKPAIPQTLEELNDFFVLLISGREARPYYFQNYIQFAQVCPKVSDLQRSVVEDFADVILRGIQKLTESGIFRQDCASEYKGIVQCILAVITYGAVPPKERSVEEQLACIWSVLRPCLTTLGIDVYTSKLFSLSEEAPCLIASCK